MSLIIITEAVKLMDEAGTELSMEDREFIARYAFRTGDTELTEKLIEEISTKGADKEAIQTKYMQLADRKSEWAEQIENLLIALEMYRIEEEKAVKRIREFLAAHGIDISKTVLQESGAEELKSMVSEAKNGQQAEQQPEQSLQDEPEQETQQEPQPEIRQPEKVAVL